MARAMGVSRSSLYYVAKQDKKDWALKDRDGRSIARASVIWCAAIGADLGREPETDETSDAELWHQALPQAWEKIQEIQGRTALPEPSPRHHAFISKPRLGNGFHGTPLSWKEDLRKYHSRFVHERTHGTPCGDAKGIAAHHPDLGKRALPPSSTRDLSFGQREGI